MSSELSPLAVAFCGLGAALLPALLTWLASLKQQDVSLVDRTWPLMIAAPAFAYALLLPATGGRRWVALALLSVWAVRLAWHITRRNWGHGEDRRYQAIRARNQPNFAFKSLYLVFALQAVLAWVVSGPLFATAAGSRDLNLLDLAGVALAAFGIVFEAVADAQLSRFRADPRHRGQVLDTGLWRYSRHPNYFGECCTWWGLFLLALAGAGWPGLWSVASPLLMTFLLLKVSGVSLLEQDIVERRPQYRDYVARTPAFFPGRPRRAGAAQS